MISRVPVLLIALKLLWCDPLIPRSHAQQAQTLTSAVQVIGIVGVNEKTKGTLSLVNRALRFSHAKGNADVNAASIEDVVTGGDSQRVIGGTLGTVTQIAAPFGSGRILSLFRTKLDTLTIKYRDANGGLHGVMPLGKAEILKQELIARGAQTSIPTQADPNKTNSDTKEKKP